MNIFKLNLFLQKKESINWDLIYIYIWIKDFCLVLSPELNCGYLAKLNFFDKYVGFSILREPWDNKIFNYWEAQDTQKQNMHT